MKSAADNNPIRPGVWGGALPAEISERATLRRALARLHQKKAATDLVLDVRTAERGGILVDLANTRHDLREAKSALARVHAEAVITDGKVSVLEGKVLAQEEDIESVRSSLGIAKAGLAHMAAEVENEKLANDALTADRDEARSASSALLEVGAKLKADNKALSGVIFDAVKVLKASSIAASTVPGEKVTLALAILEQGYDTALSTDERVEKHGAAHLPCASKSGPGAATAWACCHPWLAHCVVSSYDGSGLPSVCAVDSCPCMGFVEPDRKNDAVTIPAADVKHLRESLSPPDDKLVHLSIRSDDGLMACGAKAFEFLGNDRFTHDKKAVTCARCGTFKSPVDSEGPKLSPEAPPLPGAPSTTHRRPSTPGFEPRAGRVSP